MMASGRGYESLVDPVMVLSHRFSALEWSGQLNLLLALVVVALGVILVRGWIR